MKATKGGGEGGNFDAPPAGSIPGVLVALIDLGTHTEEYDGASKETHKVYLAWELTGEAKPGGGGNFFIGRDYTYSFAESANLRKVVQAWRGKDFAQDEEFDLAMLLGKPCLLSLLHKQSQSGR